MTQGQEEKALDEAVFSAKTDELRGPVKTPFGYYIFKVTGTTPGSSQTLAQSEAEIKQQLAATGQQTALEQVRRKNSAKSGSSQNRHAPAATRWQDCHGYKKPATTSTEGTTGASGTTTVK